MNSAARKEAWSDPQSGPSQANTGLAGFYHFNMQWVRAEPGKIVGVEKSNYIRRAEHTSVPHSVFVSVPKPMNDTSALRASTYITRDNGDANVSGELGAHVLITRGLRATTGEQLARLLDAKERKADRSYRCYGGRMPRVASHTIMSFRYGVTPERSAAILTDFAHAISDRLKVTVEGQVHNKDGRPDHMHLLLGTRVVEAGVLGRKCRQLDAVSEKADGHSIDVGGRVVGETIEWMRAEWARLNREATGDLNIDHRSYVRQGIDLKPVTSVSRADIEYEKRRGVELWREKRRLEMADRSDARATHQFGSDPESDRISAIVPEASRIGRSAQSDRTIEIADAPRGARAQEFRAEHEAGLSDVEVPKQTNEPEAHLGERSAEGSNDAVGRSDVGPRAAHRVEHVRRSADALFDAYSPSTTNLRSGIAEGSIADQMAELIGLPGCGDIVQHIIRNRAVKHARAEFKEPCESDHQQVQAYQMPGRPLASVTGEKRAANDTVEARAAVQVRPSDAASADAPPEGYLKGTDRLLVNVSDPGALNATGAHLQTAAHDLQDDLSKESVAPQGAHSERPVSPDIETAAPLEVEQGRHAADGTHANLSHAIAVFQVLGRANRLSESRVEALAAFAGLDRGAFQFVGARSTMVMTPAELIAANILPPPLQQQLQQWMADDNDARRDRRKWMKDGSQGSPAASAPVFAMVADAKDAEASATAEPSGDSDPYAALKGHFSNARELLDRVRFQAFEAEVLSVFTHVKKPAPTARDLHLNIALHLRASGRNADEVGRILQLGALSPRSAIGQPEREAIVRDAFSDRWLPWLEKNPIVQERATTVEKAFQKHTISQLRREALEKLKADLDDVWIHHRMQADVAKRRHQKRMAFLYDQRWKLRRLRRRGLVALMVSVTVEKLFLQRLIERQKAKGLGENQDIRARATELTAQLRALRERFRRLKEMGKPSALASSVVKDPAVQSNQQPGPGKSDATDPIKTQTSAPVDKSAPIKRTNARGPSAKSMPKTSGSEHSQSQESRPVSTTANTSVQTAGAETLSGGDGASTDTTGSLVKQTSKGPTPTSGQKTEPARPAASSTGSETDKAASSSGSEASSSVVVDPKRLDLAAKYFLLLVRKRLDTDERKKEIALMVGCSPKELRTLADGIVNSLELHTLDKVGKSRTFKLLSKEIYEKAESIGFEELLMMRERLVAETKRLHIPPVVSRDTKGQGTGRG